MFDRNFSSLHCTVKEQVIELFVIVFLVFDISLVGFGTKPILWSKETIRRQISSHVHFFFIFFFFFFQLNSIINVRTCNIQLSMHELIDRTRERANLSFSLEYWCSFLSLDCTYSLEIYSYATTEFERLIQLSDYARIQSVRLPSSSFFFFALSIFNASLDISSYACQS